MISRRVLGAVLAAGLVPGKLRAAEALERLQVHSRPRPAPDFVLQDADGAEVRPAAFQGQGVVLNFWATWCPPCVEEMPALERLHAALADDAIRVVAASQDRAGAAAVHPFYARNGITGLAVWLDARGAAGRAFGIPGLPTTVILDRQGQEVARLVGAAAWDAPAAAGRLRRMLPRAPVAAGTTAT